MASRVGSSMRHNMSSMGSVLGGHHGGHLERHRESGKFGFSDPEAGHVVRNWYRSSCLAWRTVIPVPYCTPAICEKGRLKLVGLVLIKTEVEKLLTQFKLPKNYFLDIQTLENNAHLH